MTVKKLLIEGDICLKVLPKHVIEAEFLGVFPAKDKGEKKLFGFAFTPLMREDGTTLSDESHELYVYKVMINYVFQSSKIGLQLAYYNTDCCKTVTLLEILLL